MKSKVKDIYPQVKHSFFGNLFKIMEQTTRYEIW